jgi:tetratricopeptide (TPR) repeat protein
VAQDRQEVVMRKHPDRKALKGFISGELPSEEARHIERHLSMCSKCRDQADAISDQLTLQLLDSWLRPSYDEAFERAADRTAECLENLLEESRSTEVLLAELLREPAPLRRRRIADGERFHSLKFCQLLLERSRDVWLLDPAVALQMADLGVEVALHLESGRYGSSLVEDSRALAWSYLANALRITSDFQRAEQALRQAWSHHIQGEGDAYTEAWLLRITLSLRQSQDRYEEASRFVNKVIDIYRDAQDGSLECAALIHKGRILAHLCHPDQAIPVIRTGLDLIDPVEEPLLWMVGTNNIIANLNLSGAPAKAQEILAKNSYRYKDFGEINVTRLHWLEGQISMGLDQFSEAEKLLREVREFFLERGVWADVICSSLDLAGLYTVSRQPRKVREVLDGIIPLGEALGLSKKVFLAKMLFERASRS